MDDAMPISDISTVVSNTFLNFLGARLKLSDHN